MIRHYKPEDYETLDKWWKSHQWSSPTPGMLSKTGFVVEGLCAGFLYKTDSEWALLEFIVSNPESNEEERSKGLDLLIDTLTKEAQKENYKFVFTTSNHNKLIERFVKHNYVVTDKNVTHIVGRIK